MVSVRELAVCERHACHDLARLLCQLFSEVSLIPIAVIALEREPAFSEVIEEQEEHDAVLPFAEFELFDIALTEDTSHGQQLTRHLLLQEVPCNVGCTGEHVIQLPA